MQIFGTYTFLSMDYSTYQYSASIAHRKKSLAITGRSCMLREKAGLLSQELFFLFADVCLRGI